LLASPCTSSTNKVFLLNWR